MQYPSFVSVIGLVFVLWTASVSAETLCSPKANSARILTKPSPNAIHPDFSGDSFVGLGWGFNPEKIVTNVTGRYARGNLRGSHGGVRNAGVYILLSEWSCEEVAPTNADLLQPDVGDTVDLSLFKGTWEQVGNQCSASMQHMHGNYFNISQSSFLPGDGSTCDDVRLVPHGQDVVEITGSCRNARGTPSKLERRLKATNGLLQEGDGPNASHLYEKCDMPTDAQSVRANACVEGSYGYAEISNTLLYSPILKASWNTMQIVSGADEGTVWNEIKCDELHRVATIRTFRSRTMTEITSPEYVGDSHFVRRFSTKSPSGQLLTGVTITRDDENRPVKIETQGEDGAPGKIGNVVYEGNKQLVEVLDSRTGLKVQDWVRWFYPDGSIRTWRVNYPTYWLEYQYDVTDGHLKTRYGGDAKGVLEKTSFQNDRWLALTSEETIALAERNNIVKKLGGYSNGHLVKETMIFRNGGREEWKNVFDGNSLKESRMSVNGRFVVKFVVSMNGQEILGTTAYAPDGHKLFYYPGVAQKYISRDGSPTNGTKFEKLSKRLAW